MREKEKEKIRNFLGHQAIDRILTMTDKTFRFDLEMGGTVKLSVKDGRLKYTIDYDDFEMED